MKIRTVISWIIILVAIDQIIKIIVNSFFLESRFDIIPSFFEFRPTFNDKHSYFNVLLYKKFKINIGLYAHIIFFLFFGVVLLIFYGYLRNHIKNKKLQDIAFIFLYSGIICALIGNIIWKKGTLDYIYLKPLFVFDLKDLYNNCFAILLIIFVLKNNAELNKIKIRDLVLYIKNDVFKRKE